MSFIGLKKANSRTSVVIPATATCSGRKFKVTAIDSKALYKDTKVKTVTIGKCVKTIEARAFSDCRKLSTVKGGTGVVQIKDYAFCNCAALKAFPAMKKLESIGSYAFKSCIKLPKFMLGTAVKSIGKSAFQGCKSLKTIHVQTTKLTNKNVGALAFKGISKKATFRCPKKKAKAYKKLFISKGAPKTCKFVAYY